MMICGIISGKSMAETFLSHKMVAKYLKKRREEVIEVFFCCLGVVMFFTSELIIN
jgi:hypothetical protein